MRPHILYPLFADASAIKGVGEGLRRALGRLIRGSESGEVRVKDIIAHLPVQCIDRRHTPTMREARHGDLVTWTVKIEAHQPPAAPRRRGKSPYKIICQLPGGILTLVYYHARKESMLAMYPLHSKRIISGRIERLHGVLQMIHPDIAVPVEKHDTVLRVEPVYALTAGLSNRVLGTIIQNALKKVPDLPEWLQPSMLSAHSWRSWKASLHACHHPQQEEELLGLHANRMRLAYDELLASQLALALIRRENRTKNAPIIHTAAEVHRNLLQALPFTLTQGQEQVIQDIMRDMQSSERMLRLLQGDVGSGKTAVALAVALQVVACGGQVALMAPTELLAHQHQRFCSEICKKMEVNVVLLDGSKKAKAREAIYQEIAQGHAHIVIGTHALFQESVRFHNLVLAIIDEQHRFGVKQRLALAAKNKSTHMLVMTATPIPRTLAMTVYGDMDVSLLREKPAGRQEIKTVAVPLSREADVLNSIERALNAGEKIYWICPRVEESDDEAGEQKTDIAAVEARAVEFATRFPGMLYMAHGRMESEQRNHAMQGFAAARAGLLVATTVVEVGVDVTDATVIVIEHAERFGLAQLHQLRGRVGRGHKPSTCVLLYANHCSEQGRARLRVVRDSTDGFKIAEEDWRLRGAGDVLSTRQSGLPAFKFADLLLHRDLLLAARQEAAYILAEDPAFTSARAEALKMLLYLFEYDKNVRFIAAG